MREGEVVALQKNDAFQRQQLRLGGPAAGGGEAAKLAAGREHAVARHDDRHGVAGAPWRTCRVLLLADVAFR